MYDEAELRAALEREYGLKAERCELMRRNENETWRVSAGGARYVLRVRRAVADFDAGLVRRVKDARAAVEGEARLLEGLRAAGMDVQRPVRTPCGALCAEVDGAPALLLEWLEGETPEGGAIDRALGERIGGMTARLHAALRGQPALNSYGPDALERIGRELDAAAEAGDIGAQAHAALRAALGEIGARLGAAPRTAWQTVHADLSPGNLLLRPDGNVAPIDFSLSGLCVREMDLVALFGQIPGDEARAGILACYALEGGEVDWGRLEACFALQIMLFIAAQHARFAREEWFGEMLERWSRETFSPLAAGARVLTRPHGL
ncbi:MAG: phosphotransferase enzyme family protein [Candidatus Fimadaptatus sp.]